MHRLAAVSGLLAGSQKLWAGVMLAEPNTASSVHHHGPLETVVYVAEGRSLLRWGHRLEHESELEAGDFLLLPPYLPHQEINPSPDKPAMWIVVRSGPEAIVVDLARDADGEYVAAEAGAKNPSAPVGGAIRTLRTGKGRRERTRWGRTKSISVALLAASVAMFVGAVFSVSRLWNAGNDWMAVLLVTILALVGLMDVVWAVHVRTARHSALLDAYAEREIARSTADRRRS
jgi:uncharacterized RmlC-like cupin family protein